MLSMLITLFGGMVEWLLSLLPVSPFSGIALGTVTLSDAMDKGLGWLNWFVPVGSCLFLLSVWLSAAIIYGCVVAVRAVAQLAVPASL